MNCMQLIIHCRHTVNVQLYLYCIIQKEYRAVCSTYVDGLQFIQEAEDSLLLYCKFPSNAFCWMLHVLLLHMITLLYHSTRL